MIDGRVQIHLLEDQREGQDRRVRLDDHAAHDRCTRGDGAAVPDVRLLHLQHHVFEGMKLQKAPDDTVTVEFYGVPVGALHGFDHDCPRSDLTAHPA